MSELGDDFREHRDRKRCARLNWLTCKTCGLKSPPNEPCFKCDPASWLIWNAARKAKKEQP